MKYIVYSTNTGEIIRAGSVPDGSPVESMPKRPGEEYLFNVEANPLSQHVVDGKVVNLPGPLSERRQSKPDVHATWNWQTNQWEDRRNQQDKNRDIHTVLMHQINALERRQSRSVRELTIGRGGNPAVLRKRLEDIDDQIAALRAKLPPV